MATTKPRKSNSVQLDGLIPITGGKSFIEYMLHGKNVRRIRPKNEKRVLCRKPRD